MSLERRSELYVCEGNISRQPFHLPLASDESYLHNGIISTGMDNLTKYNISWATAGESQLVTSLPTSSHLPHRAKYYWITVVICITVHIQHFYSPVSIPLLFNLMIFSPWPIIIDCMKSLMKTIQTEKMCHSMNCVSVIPHSILTLAQSKTPTTSG